MYLVVGGNGYLGTYIIKSILDKTNEQIIATARHVDQTNYEYDNKRVKWVVCDVTDRDSVDALNDFISDESGKTVSLDEALKCVYLAAYHNPDLVEENTDIAWNTNITSLAYFLNKLRNIDKLFYASTDSVYGESVDHYAYSEEDNCSPVNTYGKQKLLAEKIVITYGYNAARFSFLIGPSLVNGKKHFYDKIVEDLQQGKEVKMFDDSFRSSITFLDAAGLLIDVMKSEKNVPDVVNICSDEILSKFDVGIRIAEKIGVSEKLIKPLHTAEDKTIYRTKRAGSTIMKNSLLKDIVFEGDKNQEILLRI